jgi:hypothetical protein
MHSKFYLCATGSEVAIRALQNKLEIQGSELKLLKPNLLLPSTQQKENWMWRSSYIACTSNFPEDELTAYLRKNRTLLLHLNECRHSVDELAAVIVSYDDTDSADHRHGYSISSELMALLTTANISLEIDVVAPS